MYINDQQQQQHITNQDASKKVEDVSQLHRQCPCYLFSTSEKVLSAVFLTTTRTQGDDDDDDNEGRSHEILVSWLRSGSDISNRSGSCSGSRRMTTGGENGGVTVGGRCPNRVGASLCILNAIRDGCRGVLERGDGGGGGGSLEKKIEGRNDGGGEVSYDDAFPQLSTGGGGGGAAAALSSSLGNADSDGTKKSTLTTTTAIAATSPAPPSSSPNILVGKKKNKNKNKNKNATVITSNDIISRPIPPKSNNTTSSSSSSVWNNRNNPKTLSSNPHHTTNNINNKTQRQRRRIRPVTIPSTDVPMNLSTASASSPWNNNITTTTPKQAPNNNPTSEPLFPSSSSLSLKQQQPSTQKVTNNVWSSGGNISSVPSSQTQPQPTTKMTTHPHRWGTTTPNWGTTTTSSLSSKITHSSSSGGTDPMIRAMTSTKIGTSIAPSLSTSSFSSIPSGTPASTAVQEPSSSCIGPSIVKKKTTTTTIATIPHKSTPKHPTTTTKVNNIEASSKPSTTTTPQSSTETTTIPPPPPHKGGGGERRDDDKSNDKTKTNNDHPHEDTTNHNLRRYLSTVYSVLILESQLVPSIAVELQLLVRLLCLTDDSPSSSSSTTTTNNSALPPPNTNTNSAGTQRTINRILQTPSSCRAFAIDVLNKIQPLLLRLGRHITGPLVRLRPTVQYLPGLVEVWKKRTMVAVDDDGGGGDGNSDKTITSIVEGRGSGGSGGSGINDNDDDEEEEDESVGGGRIDGVGGVGVGMGIAGSGNVAMLTVPFQERRDSRHHYRTKDLTALFNNREECRDIFLFQLRAFQEMRKKTASFHPLCQIERTLSTIQAESRKMMSQRLLPGNVEWFAEYFCELLYQIGLVPMQETDREIVKHVGDKNRLQKLHDRFTSKSAPKNNKSSRRISLSDNDASNSKIDVTPDRHFTGHQEFFYRFILSVDSYRFGIHLRRRLVASFHSLLVSTTTTTTTTTNTTRFIVEGGGIDVGGLERRLSMLQLIVKFIGMLAFSPYWNDTKAPSSSTSTSTSTTATSPSPLSNNGLTNTGAPYVTTTSFHEDPSSSYHHHIIPIRRCIEEAWRDRQLCLTIPWVLQYLRMAKWDDVSLRSEPYRKETVGLLRTIHRRIGSLAKEEDHYYYGINLLHVALQLESFFTDVVGLGATERLPFIPLPTTIISRSSAMNDNQSVEKNETLVLSSSGNKKKENKKVEEITAANTVVVAIDTLPLGFSRSYVLSSSSSSSSSAHLDELRKLIINLNVNNGRSTMTGTSGSGGGVLKKLKPYVLSNHPYSSFSSSSSTDANANRPSNNNHNNNNSENRFFLDPMGEGKLEVLSARNYDTDATMPTLLPPSSSSSKYHDDLDDIDDYFGTNQSRAYTSSSSSSSLRSTNHNNSIRDKLVSVFFHQHPAVRTICEFAVDTILRDVTVTITQPDTLRPLLLQSLSTYPSSLREALVTSTNTANNNNGGGNDDGNHNNNKNNDFVDRYLDALHYIERRTLRAAVEVVMMQKDDNNDRGRGGLEYRIREAVRALAPVGYTDQTIETAVNLAIKYARRKCRVGVGRSVRVGAKTTLDGYLKSIEKGQQQQQLQKKTTKMVISGGGSEEDEWMAIEDGVLERLPGLTELLQRYLDRLRLTSRDDGSFPNATDGGVSNLAGATMTMTGDLPSSVKEGMVEMTTLLLEEQEKDGGNRPKSNYHRRNNRKFDFISSAITRRFASALCLLIEHWFSSSSSSVVVVVTTTVDEVVFDGEPQSSSCYSPLPPSFVIVLKTVAALGKTLITCHELTQIGMVLCVTENLTTIISWDTYCCSDSHREEKDGNDDEENVGEDLSEESIDVARCLALLVRSNIITKVQLERALLKVIESFTLSHAVARRTLFLLGCARSKQNDGDDVVCWTPPERFVMPLLNLRLSKLGL